MKALLKKSAILKTISSKISTYLHAPHRIFQMHCKALQKPMRLPPLGPLMSR